MASTADGGNTTDMTTKAVTESSKCSEAFPKAQMYYDALVDYPVELTFICIAVILSILTVILFGTEVHAKDYKRLKDPGRRRQILILLFIYPMTSVMALFAIIVPKSTFLADLLAACYLSFCLYVFIRAFINYYGDTSNMVKSMSPHQISIRTPPCCCCCCCFPLIHMTTRSMSVIKLLVMQVGVFQPLVLFLKAVVWANDNESVNQSGWDSPFLYLNIATAVSTLFAMYGLTILIRASELDSVLVNHRIKIKFVLLQLVLITSSIQSLIFSILIRFELPPCEEFYSARVRASLINHIIIVIEMFILAVAARKVYHTSDHSSIVENLENGTVDFDKVDNSSPEERNSSLTKPV